MDGHKIIAAAKILHSTHMDLLISFVPEESQAKLRTLAEGLAVGFDRLLLETAGLPVPKEVKPTPVKVDYADIQDRVLAFIADHPECTMTEIVGALGNTQFVRRTVFLLEDQHSISSVRSKADGRVWLYRRVSRVARAS